MPLGQCVIAEAGCNWYLRDINICSLSKNSRKAVITDSSQYFHLLIARPVPLLHTINLQKKLMDLCPPHLLNSVGVTDED